jgi:hypothetical protein
MVVLPDLSLDQDPRRERPPPAGLPDLDTWIPAEVTRGKSGPDQ